MVNPIQLAKRVQYLEPHNLDLRRLHRLWKKACQHDGIPSTKQFANFSKRNPWIHKVHQAQMTMQLIKRMVRLHA